MLSALSNTRQRGTTTLEFALIGGIFLTLLISVVDLGRYLAVAQSLNTVVSLVARAAVVGNLSPGGSCPGSGVTLPTSITGSVPLLDTNKLCVAVTTKTVSGQLQTSVAAQYTFAFVLPAWSAFDTTMTDSTFLTY